MINLGLIIYILIILLGSFVLIVLENLGVSKIEGGSAWDEELKLEGFKFTEIKEINKVLEDKNFNWYLDNVPDNLVYRKPSKSRLLYRIHVGQRKLLLNEIIFLVEYGNLSKEIVYAGAAPGQHTPFLSELFPEHHFELWDPAPFVINESTKINLYNDYFTNTSAEKYKNKNVLFISDIRSGSDSMNYLEFEKEVELNNQYHLDWINIIKPRASMLKFRIPFTTIGDYKYLDGKIYLQPWAPIDSAETRLICTTDDMKNYDPKEYENKMFYYNNIIREFQSIKHDIPLDKVKGICYCSDCNFEINVWKLYVTKIMNIKDNINEKIIEFMNKTSKSVDRSLLAKFHGYKPEISMDNKRLDLKDKSKEINNKFNLKNNLVYDSE